MEGDPDDLDNIFDDYESTSHQDGEDNVNNDENPAANEEKTPERVAVPKKIIRQPRLTLNPDRLCGERGIPVLANHFKDVKFKGKGHEKEDLNKLMTTLTHWCHRLFPSMKFEDCLRQIERLGKKRPVQTCIRKIRLDMPILNADFVDDEVAREEDPDEPEVEAVPEDAFDRLFNESTESRVSNFASPCISNESTGNTLGTSFGSTLTEEQKKRMEYNRLLATERRKARLASMQSATLESNNNDSNQVLQSSESLFASLVSNHHDETSNSITELPAQSLDSENVNDSEELDQIVIRKDSEELEMDELMDLVEDEDQTIENGKDLTNSSNVTLNNEANLSEDDEINTHNTISKSSNQDIDSEHFENSETVNLDEALGELMDE